MLYNVVLMATLHPLLAHCASQTQMKRFGRFDKPQGYATLCQLCTCKQITNPRRLLSIKYTAH